MSNKSKANPGSRWLANKDGWSRLCGFKARKKRTNKNTATNKTKKTNNNQAKSLHQLNLRGETSMQ
jgi:hypothetical protein